MSVATKAEFDAKFALTNLAGGDTVKFPASGSSTWTASATVDHPVTIDGNGTSLTASGTLNDGLFYINGFTSSALARITGFGDLDAGGYSAETKAIKVKNVTLTALRIDHNTFHQGYNTIEVGGSFGVIDHNNFYNGLGTISFTAGSDEQATASWAVMAAGTGNALFIETNYFIKDSNYSLGYSQEDIGTFNGGKLVCRYNHHIWTGYPNNDIPIPIELHGNAAAGAPNGYWQAGTGGRRGQSVVEIYENEIVGHRVEYLCVLRGSSTLVWNNRVTNAVVEFPKIYLREEEYYLPQFSPQRVDWPAEDQVHNSFFGPNTFNGNPQTADNILNEFESDTPPRRIQQDRDYFLHLPQSSGGKESFTGDNGATSSYPTDGVVLPNLGNMTFTGSGANAYYPYAPYIYPHPLVGGTTLTVTGTATIGTIHTP